jgi:hypothetical protein
MAAVASVACCDNHMLNCKGYRLLDPDVYARLSVGGSVCKAGRTGSVIELQRIEGTIFKTSKEAEAHGLELARAWVDRKSAWRLSADWGVTGQDYA